MYFRRKKKEGYFIEGDEMPIVFPVDEQDSRISRERPGRGTEKTRTVMLGAVKDL